MLKTVWNFLTANKKAALAVFVASALLYGAYCTKSWYDDQILATHNNAVLVTDTKWEKVIAQKDKETAKFKSDQELKRSVLEKELEDARRLNTDPKSNGGDKQIEYIKKPTSKEKVLDDDFVEIYNDSIGVK